jgi:two-component system CheB/CheR fusion protein
MRWRDPELGDMSPAEFIPIAEACGLIHDLNRVAMRALVGQIATWRGLGLVPPPIAFNVSARSIRESDFSSALLDLLAQHAIDTAAVRVEITESALLDNVVSVRDNFAALNAAGIDVSIDDFGTGYSSLNYLKRLPLSELKIDKSFVDGLGCDPEDEAIARAVLALASALDLKTVAEGVETEAQREWLADHGCGAAQGYLLARPLEVVDYEDMLARRGAA